MSFSAITFFFVYSPKTTGTVQGLRSGETLAGYEILNLLGSGPEGQVDRVSGTTSYRVEAMKALGPTSPADSGVGRSRFTGNAYSIEELPGH